MAQPRIELVKGDITKIKVDAMVNAANKSLLGGGGVDGAIHRVAGPELLEECKILGGCEVGEAKITGGYRLPCTWVIHAVGPRWKGGGDDEEKRLAECYRHSLELAEKCFVRTISFPAISTGAYGFPVDKASAIAVSEIKRFLAKNKTIDKVLLVCFDSETYDAYLSLLKER